MKVKNIILLPTLIMVLAGCSTNATSFTSVDSNHPINSEAEKSSELPVSYFQFSVDGVHELRKPSEIQNGISYEIYQSESFTNFRNKMRAFSNKLSDIFVKREFIDGKNFAISPLSIELCIGLAIRSASGETRNELLAALDMDYETFNANYKSYYKFLYHSNKNNMDYITSQLLLTNSIWIDNDIKLKDSGLDALRDNYYCYSYDVDFNGNNKNANQAIKEFINYNTKGLINPELSLSPDTLFVLMNTLYIKDIWNEVGGDLEYAPNTYKFTNSDGSKSNKQLLQGYYLEGKAITTDDYSCFYTRTLGGYNIYFVKPNTGKNLKNVFLKDTMDYVLDRNNYIHRDETKMEEYETRVYFPEYTVSGDYELSEIFKEDLNVKTLFGFSCDMSSLTDERVFCDGIRHITKLEVSKGGIEGAAVTYMAYPGASAPDERYTLVQDTFVVDKEFGFILTYNDSVIFSGVVNNIDK